MTSCHGICQTISRQVGVRASESNNALITDSLLPDYA